MAARSEGRSGGAAALSFVRQAVKPLFFLSLLPAVITYFHIQRRMVGEFVYVRATAGTDSPTQQQQNYEGLYYRQQTGLGADAGAVVYRKLLLDDGPGDAVQAALALARREGGGDQIFRRPIFLVSSAGIKNGRKEAEEQQLCLFVPENNSSSSTGSRNDEFAAGAAAASAECRQPVVITNQWSNFLTASRRSGPAFWNDVTVQIPATSLIVTVNVLLAGIYWNARTDPATVAKVYRRMVGGGASNYEIWRSFSGATAHFEIWHLGLNMMSLLALGRDLEQGRSWMYPSIVFFLYNVSLIPLVTLIWLGLQWLTDRYYHVVSTSTASTSSTSNNAHHQQHHRPTVGYSGVLFAWMVVASLEQRRTCPVIFWPDLCFETYQGHYGLKFNLGPVVQLVILQVLLPRVSLSGHLAGILAGFGVHWGLLPIRFVQPAILIPVLYLLYLRFLRRAVFTSVTLLQTTRVLRGCALFWTAGVDTPYPQVLFLGQLLVLAGSLLVFGPFSSLSLSLGVSIVYWFLFCATTQGNEATSSDTAPASFVFARGFIVAAVLVLINDAMAIGSWLALHSCSWFLTFLIVARTVTLLASLFLAQLMLMLDRGILERTLGFTTLQPLRALSNHPWLPKITATAGESPLPDEGDAEANDGESSSWAPFAGGGQRLGGGSVRARDQEAEASNSRELSRLL